MNRSPHLSPLANRQATTSGDWYHLVPMGEYPHPDSQILQVIDEQAIAAIANRFIAESAQAHFAGLLIDQEHFSYDPDKSSAAYGWVRRVENREDGLWGQVEWTGLGAQALRDKTYKFISPVWLPRDTEPVTNRAANVRRPLRLDSLGLTNSPNLRGMVPLVNRNNCSQATNPAGGSPANKHMNRVAAHLGLAAEASEDAILAAITALTNRATKAEAQVTPLTNRITALEAEIKTTTNAMIDHDLAPLANRIPPEEIATWRDALIANRTGMLPLLKGFISHLPAAKAPVAPSAGAPRAPIANRAVTPDERDAQKAPASQDISDAKARVIANRARELVKSSGAKLTYTQAFEQAKAEVLAAQ